MPLSAPRLVVCLALGLLVVRAQGQDRAEQKVAESALLNPARITITGHFETALRPAAFELAVRSIEALIDQKPAADAAQAPLDRLWKNSFLKFIPIAECGHPEAMMSPTVTGDDPFFTPAYLTVIGRQLDYQMALSEKRTLILFSP